MTDFNDVIANIAANFEAQIQLLVRDARQESYESGWKNGNASSEDAHADDRATRDADSFERGYKVGRADEIETAIEAAIEAANNPSHPSSTEFQEETFRLGKSEGDMLGYERGYTAGFEDGQDEQRAMDAPIIREQFDLDPDFDPDLDPYAGVYGGEEF